MPLSLHRLHHSRPIFRHLRHIITRARLVTRQIHFHLRPHLGRSRPISNQGRLRHWLVLSILDYRRLLRLIPRGLNIWGKKSNLLPCADRYSDHEVIIPLSTIDIQLLRLSTKIPSSTTYHLATSSRQCRNTSFLERGDMERNWNSEGNYMRFTLDPYRKLGDRYIPLNHLFPSRQYRIIPTYSHP